MQRNPASFRDPAGVVFKEDNTVYRAVAESYLSHFEHATKSGLYSELIKAGLLIDHSEVAIVPFPGFSRVIQPEVVPVISYPWEWCFSQLKAAALATLSIQKRSLQQGMILKDANAFNIQFFKGKPVLIDTLSFEILKPGEPWAAYRQFCEHFLGPLALIHYTSQPLSKLLLAWPEGIPLQVVAALLPTKSKLNAGIAMHLLLHSKATEKAKPAGKKQGKISEKALWQMADHLESTIRKLTWKSSRNGWAKYMENDVDDDYLAAKSKTVSEWLKQLQPGLMWDLGANTGHFSIENAAKAGHIVALEADYEAVEKMIDAVPKNVLPLVFDVANPSPSLGWNGEERSSLLKRARPDTILALALTHHLRISRQVPFFQQAECWAGWTTNNLIVEFVPPADEKVKRISQHLQEPFPDYSQSGFEAAFHYFFKEKERVALPGGRLIYLFEKR